MRVASSTDHVDFQGLPPVSRMLLSSETFAAIVVNGFFITLLAKRWFRS